MFSGSADVTPIGTKLEEFYLALYAPPGQAFDADRVIECMHQLEGHHPLVHFNETNVVVDEIVKDCRKKCSQQLRAPFAEVIRNVIALCRKRLVSKAALDSESSNQHSQRHLNTLIELLGTWSNIVAQCVDYSFSRALTRQILSPLYTRIVEASVECFKTFRRDKELDQWGAKLLDESYECNVASLDFLVSQVSGMKELLHQHYCFLYRHFSTYDMDAPTTEPLPVGTVENMLIVSSDELLQWRELDAVYVTMEFGFINRATQEALRETELLEVEEHVYIPQCIEDIFFILSKVSYRALSTGSDSTMMGVGNRVLETIRETPPGDFDKHSFLYRLVTNKHFFRRCIERKCISSNALTKILNGPKRVTHTTSNTAMNSAYNSAHTTPHKPARSEAASGCTTPTKNGSIQMAPKTTNTTITTANGIANNTSTSSLAQMFIAVTEEGGLLSSTPGSPAVGLVNTISDITSVSLTGMNWWLSDQLSPYIGTTEYAEHSSYVASKNAVGIGGIAMKDSTPCPHNHNSTHNTNNSVTNIPGSPTLPPAGRIPLPPNSSSIHGYSTPNKSTASNKSAKMSPPPSQSGVLSSVFSMDTLYGSTSSTAPTSNNSALSLDEMLLNALVGDETTTESDFYFRTESLAIHDFTNITTTYTDANNNTTATISTDYFEHSMYVDELRAKLTLCEDDWVVQLNTLCTVASCTGTLRGIYTQGVGITDIYKTSNGRNSTSPVELIIQELSTCEARYRSLLSEETKIFARWVYTCHIELPWMEFCTKSFTISGEEMETRSAHSALHSILRKCFGMTPLEKFELEQLDKQLLGNKQRVAVTKKSNTTSSNHGTNANNSEHDNGANNDTTGEENEEMEDCYAGGSFMRGSKSRLSQGAYIVFLEELCNVLASQLFEKLIFRTQFNEWGALLLYQEVISLSAYMEQLIDHMDPAHIRTVKATFDTLNLALKILTLDGPGDIRRYSINSAVLSETQAQTRLAAMTDLSNPSNIRLVYFDIPAKAEPVRLAFHVGGINFTDERVNGAQWQSMKAQYGQYAQIPLLEVDGKRIYQTVNLILYAALITGLNATNLEDELRLREILLACDDIPNTFSGTFGISNAEERIVARTVLFKPGGRTYCQMKRIEELVGDREYLVGDRLTVADLTVFTNCCMLRCGHFDGFPRDCLDGYPKLKAFVERIASLPKVAEYYSSHTSAWAAGFRPGA